MAFIDNIKALTERRDRQQEKFLISMREKIECVAKNSGHQVGFWVSDLSDYAKQALDREPSVSEIFDLFDLAVKDLRNQGFKVEANMESGYVVFVVKW